LANKTSFYHILLIFLIALLIGIGFGLYFFSHFPESCNDVDGFGRLAASFAQNFTFGGSIRRGPVYPFLIGMIYYFFGTADHTAVILFNGLCFACLGVLGYFISFKIFNSLRTAFWTGIFIIFNPIVFWYVPRLWVELPFALFILIMVYAAGQALKNPSLKNLILFGIFAAISALCKAVTLLFPIFLAICICFLYIFKNHSINHLSRADLLKILIIPSVIMMVVITPWTLRNNSVSGSWVLVSSNMGLEFFRGNVFAEENSFLLTQTIPQIYEKSVKKENEVIARSYYTKPTWAQIDRLFTPLMWDFIFHSPQRFAVKVIKQIPAFWMRGETREKSYIFIIFSIGSIIAFIGGFVKLRKKIILTYVILSFVVYLNLLHASLLALARYSMPLYPLLTIIATPFVLDIFKSRKKVDKKDI